MVVCCQLMAADGFTCGATRFSPKVLTTDSKHPRESPLEDICKLYWVLSWSRRILSFVFGFLVLVLQGSTDLAAVSYRKVTVPLAHIMTALGGGFKSF
jgi:hypothetical protein